MASPWSVLLISLCICFRDVNGQQIQAVAGSASVQIGMSLDFTLGAFDVGSGNTLVDIVGGYLMPGSCSMQPLVYWNASSAMLMVYQKVAAEAPEYANRITIPSSKTMKINNITIDDQNRQLVYRMFYSNPLTRSITTNGSKIIVTDFSGVDLNTTSSTVTTIEGNDGFSIQCSSSGIPKPRVYWMKDGRSLPSQITVIYPMTAGNLNVSILSIPTLERQFRGMYTCKSENFAHNGTKSFTLSVKSSPEKVMLNSSCAGNDHKVCFSAQDTVDSQASNYSVSFGSMFKGVLSTAPSCIPVDWFQNVSSSSRITVTVDAANQYGRSGGAAIMTEDCSAAAAINVMRSLILVFLCFAVTVVF